MRKVSSVLALHILNRPLAVDEPLPRELFLAIEKLLAEGGPKEQGLVLGWLLCARSLRISLPEDKHHTWSKDILDCLVNKGTSYKSFESLFGRLENAAMIITQDRYFMNRLRGLL